MKYLSIIGALLLTTGTTLRAGAQHKDALRLNTNDEYTKTSSMSSSVTMKRGDKQLDMQTTSSITKLYRVTGADNGDYALSISTKQITDTINAFGKKVAYSTERAPDTSSAIEMGLAKMSRVNTIRIDQSGKITKVDDLSNASFDPKLLAITGVYAKPLTKGNNIGLGVNFTIPENAKPGQSWTEAQKEGLELRSTNYSVKEMTDATTTITFTTEVKEKGANSNVNGLLVIDNASGVILQRVIKSNMLSNEIMNGSIYAASRKDILVETCTKTN